MSCGRALDDPLAPFEIGRVLLHLNQRRGFKSNKKEEARADAKAKRKQANTTPKPNAEKKPEDILLEMADLERAITKAGCRTLGEYLYRKQCTFIKGMETDWMMAKAIGKRWHKLPDDAKDEIVARLIENIDDDDTHEQLVNRSGLSPEQADAALGLELPAGYVRHSLAAISRLLPHLKVGLVYEHRDPAKSARAAAGYDEPWALQRRIFDKLPDPRRAADSPIGDDAIREIVRLHLNEADIDVVKVPKKQGRPKVVFQDMKSREETEATHALQDVRMPTGMPIKKVRLHIPNETIVAIREQKAEKSDNYTQIAHVDTDEIHHVALFQWKDENRIRRAGVFVSQLAAMKRLAKQRQQLSELKESWKKEGVGPKQMKKLQSAAMRGIARKCPIIQVDASQLDGEAANRIPPYAEFVCSLTTGDMVLVEMDERKRLMVVSTLVSTQGGRIHLVDSFDARRKKRDKGTKPNSLIEKYKAREVTVDPLGRIRWAHD